MSGTSTRLRLGVNIDHVATVRNARGGFHPDPLRAAMLAMATGADGITAHLREDRRHITDNDLSRLIQANMPINLEIAATVEMQQIAVAVRPSACCLVPERREERTTEGGLDVAGNVRRLQTVVTALKKEGIATSLFVEPDSKQLHAARMIGAEIVELHTGAYCNAADDGETDKAAELLETLRRAARQAAELGFEVHAGHGLGFGNAAAVAAIPEIAELQIGHFIVGEAVFVGLEAAIRRMRKVMDDAR